MLGNLSMGAIAVIVAIILFLVRYIGNPKKKDAIVTGAWILLIGGVVIGGTGVFQELRGVVQAAPVAITGEQAVQVTVPVSQACERQTDGTNTLNVVYRNVENSSLGYLAASVAAEVNGESKDSGTTTAGSTLSNLALNVPPCETGKIYALQSTGSASSVIDYSSFVLTSGYEIKGAAASVFNILARDSSLTEASSSQANGSVEITGTDAVSGSGTTDGNAYYKNTTLASGGSLNFYLDLALNDTSGVYGAMINGNPASDGVVISLDTVDASKFSVNSMTLTSDTAGVSLRKLTTCPSDISANRNSEVCWETRSLKATDGEVRIRGTLKADLGNPASDSSDSPKLCFDDRQFFRDTDGDVKYGSYDTAGTNKGIGATCITFVTN